MEAKRRGTLIYSLLLGVWALVVAWQVEEHHRVKEAAKYDLRNSSKDIANDLSTFIRALSFRGQLLQQRLELVLNERVNVHTNELVSSSGLIYIALLNTAGEPIADAVNTNLIPNAVKPSVDLTQRETWTRDTVTFVDTIEGASVNPEGTTNPPVVMPGPPADFTNRFQRRGPPRDDTNFVNAPNFTTNTPSDTNVFAGNFTNGQPPPPPNFENRPRGGGGRGRPPWLFGMSDSDFRDYITRHELHGLVITMSTENYLGICTRDLWMRFIIALFAGISAIGAGLAWRNTTKTSELQIRLIRASEMNSHLKEMNLAAAGLAHETRNPLNIIRGMAQMLSKEATAPPEIRDKARAIVDETDKVTVQLNEFINYSRPREVRRTKLALNSAIGEVMRALNHDIDDKKIKLETKGDFLTIEADEQLLRQLLFNLLLNAVQAVGGAGEIQVVTGKQNAAEAFLEIRDNGPGVPTERRQEIFKPYFTTHQKGTGLGLAVVQQIVLAHGWEIECLPNEPKGAIFRITHLKLAA
ncbi:MAG TPA: ATP-binding protein [Verrucomicrobiae bacterium]